MDNIIARFKTQTVDLLNFIRFELSFLGGFIGILGYIIFNPLSSELILVFLSSFCTLAILFSYKKIRDTKDGFLAGQTSSLATGRNGIFVVIIFFLIGLVSSSFLSFLSIGFYLFIVFVDMSYGFFRLNVRPSSYFFKNFYGAFGLSLLFLFGTMHLNPESLFYYFLFSLLVFPGSIVADLRDYKEDLISGKKTLPTIIGYRKSKAISSFILLGFSFMVFGLYIKTFFLFGIFSLLMILLVMINKPRLAHLLGGLSFLLNSIILMII